MRETVYTERMVKTDDLRIRKSQPLITPIVLAEEMPLPENCARLIQASRQTIEQILQGKDRRRIVIVGPCSIHDPDAALEYAYLLKKQTGHLLDALFPVMRVYFEKPRSIIGWKGLINDPALDGSYQINRGLHLARKLLLDLAELEMPAASEFLDTTFGQYYAELVSFGAIGARTVESQIHRELASGLSMPVGFKNRTDGDISVAIDAIMAASHPHWFPSITKEGVPAVLQSAGNEQCCLVLRGGTKSGPNYKPDAVKEACAKLRRAGLPESMLIDCSHGNSGKDPSRQAEVAASVAAQLSSGNNAVKGVMLESHLVGGSQIMEMVKPHTYGQSITDACLSLDETIPILESLADAIRKT